MGNIRIDTSRFNCTHPNGPDLHQLALWTFDIAEQEVCFWGRYSVAEETARYFARTRGLDHGVITLVESSGHTRGFIAH